MTDISSYSFSQCDLSSVQFSQSCPTLCNHMGCSMPGLSVHHQLPDLLKLMSTESVMPSNLLILCHPLLLLPSIFPSIRVFSNESVLLIGGQSIRASVSASVIIWIMQIKTTLRFHFTTNRIAVTKKMLKLKLQYFGHLMGRADSLEKPLRLENIEGRRRRRRQRMR